MAANAEADQAPLTGGLGTVEGIAAAAAAAAADSPAVRTTRVKLQELTASGRAALSIARMQARDPASPTRALVRRLQKQHALQFELGDNVGEELLRAHARTLDALFHELLTRGLLSEVVSFEHSERFINMALRTQAQVRATVEVLMATRRISAGGQVTIGQAIQVNQLDLRGQASDQERIAPAEPNKLLQENRDGWLDTRASPAPSEADPQLEALATRHRPEDGHGKG